MPRSRWRGALPRNPFQGMPRSWSSDGMVTKRPSKARMVSCASWSDRGCLRLTFRSSGTPRCEVRFVSIPPLCDPFCRSLIKRTELVFAGLSKSQILDGIKAFDAKELPALEPGAMCYMLSKQGYLNDDAGHWRPHLMFYVPLADLKSWGADLPGSPVMLNPQFQGTGAPITEFMIPVSNWSDGTAAHEDAH